MFSGWDATVYVNEEVKHRRVNPGRAAVYAVALLVIMYALPQVGLQGVDPRPAAGQLSSACWSTSPRCWAAALGEGHGLRASPVGDRVH